MITDMTVMLYVKDVAVSSKFWQQLGFEEVLRQDLGGSITSLLIYSETGTAIQLYDIEFVRKTQPALADRRPNLLFSADYIDDIYERAKKASAQVSEITLYGEDLHIFTFMDPDGIVFAVIGEWVDIPATEEALKEFDENIKRLRPLSMDEIDDLSKPTYIFFGRKTCPWCRRMAREFPDISATIYWVDTEGTDAENPMRKEYGVKTVPTLIKRASNGMYVKYNNKSKETIAHFVGED